MPSRVTTIPMLGLLVTADGLVVTWSDTACRRRISVRAGDYFIFKLKIMLKCYVEPILGPIMGYGLLCYTKASH